MCLGDFEGKVNAFGYETRVFDGHSFTAIEQAINEFKANAGSGKPFFIIAHTHKGCGVSFMQDNAGWHGKAPNADEYKIAVEELDNAIKALEV